jgi:hypothetical protein
MAILPSRCDKIWVFINLITPSRKRPIGNVDLPPFQPEFNRDKIESLVRVRQSGYRLDFPQPAVKFQNLRYPPKKGLMRASAPVRTGAQPVLAAHRDSPHHPLRRVVVDGEDAFVKVTLDCGPILEGIDDGIERWSPTLLSSGVCMVDGTGERIAVIIAEAFTMTHLLQLKN